MNTKEIVMSVFSVAIKIVVGIIVVMFVYKYAAMAYDYGYRIFGEEPMTTGEGRTVSVTIGSDMSAKEIGQVLENKALIRDAKLFVLQERLSENHGKIQAGIYDLNTSMTAEEMIRVMASDEVATESSDDSYVNQEPEQESQMDELMQDSDQEELPTTQMTE